jgi:hypothetical protein
MAGARTGTGGARDVGRRVPRNGHGPPGVRESSRSTLVGPNHAHPAAPPWVPAGTSGPQGSQRNQRPRAPSAAAPSRRPPATPPPASSLAQRGTQRLAERAGGQGQADRGQPSGSTSASKVIPLITSSTTNSGVGQRQGGLGAQVPGQQQPERGEGDRARAARPASPPSTEPSAGASPARRRPRPGPGRSAPPGSRRPPGPWRPGTPVRDSGVPPRRLSTPYLRSKAVWIATATSPVAVTEIASTPGTRKSTGPRRWAARRSRRRTPAPPAGCPG